MYLYNRQEGANTFFGLRPPFLSAILHARQRVNLFSQLVNRYRRLGLFAEE
jgi:hypothetical protein